MFLMSFPTRDYFKDSEKIPTTLGALWSQHKKCNNLLKNLTAAKTSEPLEFITKLPPIIVRKTNYRMFRTISRTGV